MFLLAAGQSQRDLGVPARKIERERNERERLGIQAALEFLYLLAVKQELAGAFRLVAEGGASLGVGGNVHPQQPSFASADARVCFGDLGFAASQRFDFAACQHDACFQGFQQIEVSSGAAVGGDSRRFACHLFRLRGISLPSEILLV